MKSSRVINLSTVNLFLCISIFILIGVIGSSYIGSGYSEEEKDKYIIWSSNYKLRISDFTPAKYIVGDIAANASTGIHMFKNIKTGKFQAIAIFNKTKSRWNVDKIKRPDWVLNHEQRHFDITYIIVKQLNSELSIAPNSLANDLFYKYQYKLDSMQLKYDFDTDHSMDSSYQVYWNNKIDFLIKNN
jgi:hypothetical protein